MNQRKLLTEELNLIAAQKLHLNFNLPRPGTDIIAHSDDEYRSVIRCTDQLLSSTKLYDLVDVYLDRAYHASLGQYDHLAFHDCTRVIELLPQFAKNDLTYYCSMMAKSYERRAWCYIDPIKHGVAPKD